LGTRGKRTTKKAVDDGRLNPRQHEISGDM
jgi:hypothetical protein